MKNLKNILVTLIIFITVSLPGAERPPQAPKLPTFGQSIEQPSYFDRLPADLQNELLQYTLKGSGILNIPATANMIIAMKSKITPEKLIEIFKSLPTNAAALSLAETLRDVPAAQNEAVKKWLQRASRLENGRQLYNAVVANDIPRLESLLKDRSTDLNWAGGERWAPTALLRAIYDDNTDAAARLIRVGANLNIADVFDETPLMRAVIKNNEAIITMLIDAGAPINYRNITYGSTALIMAMFQKFEIIEKFLNAGANPNLQNKDGETALMRAALHGHTDVIKLLLAHGADATIRNKKGQSASDIVREIKEGTPRYEHCEWSREKYRRILEILDAASDARPQKEKPVQGCAIQ